MRPTASCGASSIGIYGDLVTADDDAVYYVGSIGSRVVRVSTQTGKETNAMTLVTDASLAAGNVPANPTGVAVGGGSVWISESDGNVLRIDEQLGGIRRIPVCRQRARCRLRRGVVVDRLRRRHVARIDPATDRGSAVVPVGRLPRGIAAARALSG